MNRVSLIILVVEDHLQQMLAYRYLIGCGVKQREIRIERSPSGKGSAENWVRRRFVKETNAYRDRQARARTALIVMIDADSLTVQHRLNQLDQALRDNGKEAVRESEQIARLIPKRNIETWVLCLNVQTVDEETDYKAAKDDWGQLIRPAAETLYRWTWLEAELPTICIGSLDRGVRELRRIGI